MRLAVARVSGRFVAIVVVAIVATLLGGCGPSDPHRQNMVTGTFNGGKLIALNEWVGTNSVATNIDAYADVSDQTPGTIDIGGPQHWRCTGVLRASSQSPASGSLFESDQDRARDKALSLPALVLTDQTAAGVGFAGPAGTYRITIEVPSDAAKFSHTWKLGDGGYSPLTMLYDNAPACTQIADTLTQQRSLVNQYLSALQRLLVRANASATRTYLQALLDQARQAKASGDGRTDPAERTADYESAAAILMKLAHSAGDSANPGLSRSDVLDITKVATNAAALLTQSGLR